MQYFYIVGDDLTMFKATKVILFALDTEDTSVTGIITGQLWMENLYMSAIIKNLMSSSTSHYHSK